jgi:signal transduction histidine kinase
VVAFYPRSLLARHTFVRELRGSSRIGGESPRAERVLATARALLSFAALVGVHVESTDPPAYADLIDALLWSYVAVSVGMLISVRAWTPPQPVVGTAIHLVDVLWAAALTALTEGPNSPFFVFFVFVLLSAAYRWGLVETVATAMVAIVLVTGQSLLMSGISGTPGTIAGAFDAHLLILRPVYLLIVAVLVGYLSESEKQRRAEFAAITRVLSQVQSTIGLNAIFSRAFGEMLRVSGANELVLVLEETDSGRLFLWRAKPGATDAQVTTREVGLDERHTYLFDAAGAAWHVTRRDRGADCRFDVSAVDGHGAAISTQQLTAPVAFCAEFPVESATAVNIALAHGWSGRLLMFGMQARTTATLRFVQNLVAHVVPPMYSIYVLRRLRTRLGGVERTRLAQDLHDGIIQSLIGLQMHVDVLRQHDLVDRSRLIQELGRIQQLLAQEIAAARELMLQVKPVDIQPSELPTYLADLADRFQRDTGIVTRFISDADEIDLPLRTCHELARIVQEALANTRKHAHARHVVVRLGSSGNGEAIVVSVDNDGRPFEFTGRWSLEDLDAARKGPVLIKERVRSIGAHLTIESNPDGGVCLKVTVSRFVRQEQTA